MRRFLLTAVGLALCTASIVALCSSIYELGHIGTCASGGPYVSARACPPGTAGTALLIPASVLAGLVGMGLYAAGGMRERRPASPIPLAIWMWSFLFLGVSGSLALAAFGPAAGDSGGGGVTTAAIILLVIFVPMALVPPLVALGASRSNRRATTRPGVPRPAPATVASDAFGATSYGSAPAAQPVGPAAARAAAPAPAAAKGDVVSRLERLNALRTAGAITADEFDRLKAQILSGSD